MQPVLPTKPLWSVQPDPVGGLLREVRPPRYLQRQDLAWMSCLLLVAAAIHYWLVIHTAVPARDSLGYARIAVNIARPIPMEDGQVRHWWEVIRNAEQPPGYPLAIAAVLAWKKPAPKDMPVISLRAAQAVNAVAGTLLVVPLYLLFRMLVGRGGAFAATVLFAVLPVPARVTSDGLSEGLYLLTAISALAAATWSVRRPTIGRFLLTGLLTGLTYLVRPEGLMIGVGAAVVAAVATRRLGLRRVAGMVLGLATGCVLVAGPYMAMIGKLTNKPTGRYLTVPWDDQLPPLWKGQPAASKGAVTRPLLAEWWNPADNAGDNRWVWAVQSVAKECLKSLHYGVGILAVIGGVVAAGRIRRGDPGMGLLVCLAGWNLILLLYLAYRIGYVSERHTVLLNALGCLLAVMALEPLAGIICRTPGLRSWVIWPRLLPAGLWAVLILTALPATLRPLHPQREGHKHTGLWLAGQLQPEDWVVDPLCWAEWYAGRTLYDPPGFHGRPRRVWVIIEEGKTSPHSRLPLWELACDLRQHGIQVYQWPPSAASDACRVTVYRVDDGLRAAKMIRGWQQALVQ